MLFNLHKLQSPTAVLNRVGLLVFERLKEAPKPRRVPKSLLTAPLNPLKEAKHKRFLSFKSPLGDLGASLNL